MPRPIICNVFTSSPYNQYRRKYFRTLKYAGASAVEHNTNKQSIVSVDLCNLIRLKLHLTER